MNKESVLDLLKHYTKHKYIELTSRGNDAILTALLIAKSLSKKKVIIPDQGGWFSYRTYPKKLGLEVVEIKTDYGLIILDILKKSLDNESVFLYANPAGYFAHQDIKKIYEVCNNKSLVILDVSGCIGDKSLCDGDYADIMVCSFGRWKPVNVGYGGLISSKKDYLMEAFSEFDKKYADVLYKKLLSVRDRLKFFYDKCEKIKKDLNMFKIIYSDRKGINVVVRFDNCKEKEKILSYCQDKGYEWTLCPRYIRVNVNAISIEVKRIKNG